MATTEERIRDGLEDNLIELAKSLHTSAFNALVSGQTLNEVVIKFSRWTSCSPCTSA